MKKMLLTALLLGTPLAAAQTAPVQPAPAQTAPAQTAVAQAPTLMLSAPVGTAAEYVMTTRISMKISAPTIEALPGKKVDPKTLEQMRQQLAAGGAQTLPAQTQTFKTFYKVTARDAAGKTTLLTTVVMPPNTVQKKAVTIRTTQTIDRAGKTEIVSMDSDDPILKSAYAAMSKEMLRAMQEQNGQQLTSPYGLPLMAGQKQTSEVSVDMQSIMGGMLGAITSAPGGEQLFQKVQATPLRAAVSTTYNGLNAQGQHSFTSAARYQPWQLRVEGKSNMPTMQMEVLGGNVTGTQLYRRDGLPGNMTMSITMNMRMTTEMEGMRVQVNMDMVQDMQMQPK